VLAKPCLYIYFTGIVGGSVIVILLIPVPQKKPGSSISAGFQTHGFEMVELTGFRPKRV
jgi:hypothetical protein